MMGSGEELIHAGSDLGLTQSQRVAPSTHLQPPNTNYTQPVPRMYLPPVQVPAVQLSASGTHVLCMQSLSCPGCQLFP